MQKVVEERGRCLLAKWLEQVSIMLGVSREHIRWQCISDFIQDKADIVLSLEIYRIL